MEARLVTTVYRDSRRSIGKMVKLSIRNANLFLFILAVLGYPCCVGFCLVAGRGGYSLGAVHGLLVAVASYGL